MPAFESSLRVTDAYRRGMVALRERGQAEARKAWAAIDPDRIDDTYEHGMLALSVSTLQREAARLSAAYVHAFVASELRRPVPVPTVYAEQVGKARSGDPLSKALRSPVISAKVGIREGKAVQLALAEGGRALEQIVGLATDTAARDALAYVSSTSPHVTGWRRAVRGTCGACLAEAKPEKVIAETPMHIHPNCHCVAEPTVQGERLEVKKGQRVELHNARMLVRGAWVRVPGPRRGVVEKLTDDAILINSGTKTKPLWVTASRFDALKPVRAAPKKLDDLAHNTLQHMNRLTPAERDAVDSYKGLGYKQVNGQLRAGKPPGPAARAIDSAAEKGSLGADATLYRAFDFPSDRGVGDVFEDKAFVSTSRRREVAELFRDKGKAMVRIQAKGGTKGVHIPGQDEEEFLLPRGTRFRITKIVDLGKQGRVIDVELLNA